MIPRLLYMGVIVGGMLVVGYAGFALGVRARSRPVSVKTGAKPRGALAHAEPRRRKRAFETTRDAGSYSPFGDSETSERLVELSDDDFFSSRGDDEDYEAMAPEDIAVHWLARATGAPQPAQPARRERLSELLALNDAEEDEPSSTSSVERISGVSREDDADAESAGQNPTSDPSP